VYAKINVLKLNEQMGLMFFCRFDCFYFK